MCIIIAAFKQASEEDKLKMIAKVLKSYQVEIDALGERSKFSEQFLVKMAKTLLSAPDPTFAFADAIVSGGPSVVLVGGEECVCVCVC